jgi:hypothetical protein
MILMPRDACETDVSKDKDGAEPRRRGLWRLGTVPSSRGTPLQRRVSKDGGTVGPIALRTPDRALLNVLRLF